VSPVRPFAIPPAPAGGRAKGIKDETRQPGTEHGIAVRDPSNGAGQIGAG